MSLPWSDPNSDPLGDIRRLADKIKADYGLREPCQCNSCVWIRSQA